MSDALGEKLAVLAAEIVSAASDGAGDPVGLETKIDAFKAVSTYHVAYTRAKMKLPGKDDDKGVDFDAFRSAVNEANTAGSGAGGTGDDPEE